MIGVLNGYEVQECGHLVEVELKLGKGKLFIGISSRIIVCFALAENQSRLNGFARLRF
jgi:hypothetical protein